MYVKTPAIRRGFPVCRGGSVTLPSSVDMENVVILSEYGTYESKDLRTEYLYGRIDDA